MMKTLGERLKKERTKRNWTQGQVAEKLGLKGHSTYANWEYSNREPDTEMLKRLANLFEVSVDYLIGDGSANVKTDSEDQDAQFILRAKEEMSPEAFEELMNFTKKMKKMLEEDE